MSVLLLVRHAETAWHHENRYAGSSDVPLTERGHRQAAQLAQWASGREIGAVYCSDLSRAVLTATPVAVATGAELHTDNRLREVDFGRGEGLTASEMRVEFPAAHSAFEANPARSPLPGGESGTAALDRAWPVLSGIAGERGAPTLVVMHSTLLRLVLCRALGIDPDNYRRCFPSVLNTAITTVSLTADSGALLAYNAAVGEVE